MNTTSHAFWAYVAVRKTRYRNNAKWIVLGAVLPDIIYYIGIVPFTIYWLSHGFGFGSHAFWDVFFDNVIIKNVRFAGHSIVVWVLGGLMWRYVRFRFVWIGWLFHIITDFFTHVTDATPVFFPLSTWTFHSWISYYDPGFYGNWFNLIDTFLVLTIGSTLFIKRLYKKHKRKSSTSV